MGHLNDSDREFLSQLRESGVLEELSPQNMIDHSNGVVVGVCSDGDQFSDIYHYHEDLCRLHRSSVRVHPISLNGGPLSIPVDSPFSTDGEEGRVMVRHLKGGSRIKSMPSVILYGHAPCGMAEELGVSAEGCLNLLVQAKLTLKLQCQGNLRVACFVHVAWKEDKKRTYFLSATKWQRR